MNEFVRNAVKESGLTGSDVARRMGVQPPTVNVILQADNPPKIGTLVRILRACGWTDEQIENTRIGDFYNLREVTGA